MHILLSNDDGYSAPGIQALAKSLDQFGDVTLVAPDRDRSGASNSLTLTRPIRAEEIQPNVFRVDGTPTDCVHLAITGLLSQEPDMVISGINSGANLGDDVLYSGTVAAAMEGRFLGYPALAVSMVGNPVVHYQTGVKVIEKLLKNIGNFSLEQEMILNVNIPDVPYDQIKGMVVTRLGNRHKAEPVIKMMDPRNRPVYWVGPPGVEQDAGEGTDFYAVKHQYVSVTPLQIDLTNHQLKEKVGWWLKTINE